MAAVIDTFKRVEDKYVLNQTQAREFLARISEHVHEDVYFRYTVHSLYYDSKGCDLMVRTLMKPDYKMKMRLRCYVEPKGNTPVFLETKKKFDDIVYKRRISLTRDEAHNYLEHGIMHHVRNNTAEEIDYLMKYYHLKRKVIIFYDRECWAANEEQDVRITLDSRIRYRLDHVNLQEYGNETHLDDEKIVLEVKAMDRYPLWLTRVLSQMGLYKGSFSKYGSIYRENFNTMSCLPMPVRGYVPTGMPVRA